MSNRTTNLGLFKWDLTNQTDLESQFDIETSMNENWDKIDENAETKQEQIEMLQEENEDLKERINDAENNELKGTVSGTSISITDSADSRVKSIGLSGNSVQKTTTGKNMFSGIKEADNTVLSDTGAYNATDGYAIYQRIKVNQNTDYTVSLKYSGTADHAMRIGLYDANDNFISRLLQTTTSYTFNSSNASYIRLSYAYNVDYEVQVEVGTSATDYEIYTYGQSPNPNYEQPIKSCGDNENLYNENITPTHYYYNAQGVIDENPARTFINQTINNLQKKSLAISYSRKVGSDTYIRINEYNTSGTFIKRTMISTTPYSLTLDTNTSYIIVCVDSDTNYYFEKLKIEYGSTATVWSPYGRTITEKIVNKNFLVLPDTIITQNGVTITIKDGVISFTGTLTSVTSIDIPISDIKLNTTDTFSLAMNDSSNVPNGLGRYLLDKDTNLIRWSYGAAGLRDATGIRPEINTRAKYFRIALNTVNTVYNNFSCKIMLEKGSTSHSFVKGEEQKFTIPCQQPMRAVDNTRDVFVKVNGVWYERHNIGRKTLDGTESVSYESAQERIVLGISNMVDVGQVRVPDVISNNFTTSISAYSATGGMFHYGANVYIYYEDVSSVSEWKAFTKAKYDAGTPVYIDYPLATPTDLQCTEEQVKALEEYSKARTYKNTTHLYGEDEVEAVVDMIYFKDLEMAINNITNAVVSLGGNV